jgi:hypothetical protein
MEPRQKQQIFPSERIRAVDARSPPMQGSIGELKENIIHSSKPLTRTAVSPWLRQPPELQRRTLPWAASAIHRTLRGERPFTAATSPRVTILFIR